MKLKAPEGTSSAAVGGVEYPVVDGYADVPAVHAAELRAHGFIPASEAPAAPAPALIADDEDSPPDALDPATMKRQEMFAFLQARGVAIVGGNSMKNDDLRAMVAAELARDAEGEAAAKAKADEAPADNSKPGEADPAKAGGAPQP